MESTFVVRALAALAQDSRLAIFRLLVQAGPEGLSVGRIGDELAVAPATLSFHLKELTHAGLIAARQEGRFIFYSADFAQMSALMGFLTENCCQGSGTACVTADACRPAQPRASARRSRETLSRARRRR